MMKRLLSFAVVAGTGLMATMAYAAPTYFNSRPAFAGTLGSSVTDNYSNPAYVFIQNNAAMSAVLGETDYMSTGFNNLNIVNGGTYCAGCNGSFQLAFTSTSVGDADGVFGVGVDFMFNTGYFAFITFGDNTTANVAISGNSGFFGITAAEEIKSIHFGLSNGGTTTAGAFGIDNLTIGGAGQHIPEPASLALALLGVTAAGASRRRAKR